MIQKNSEVKILNHPFWKGKIAKVINVDKENDEVNVKITYINSNQEEKKIIETFSFDDLKEVEKESYSELEINNLSLQEGHINNKSLIEAMKYVKDIPTRLKELFRGFTLGNLLYHDDDYKNTFDGYIDCYDMYRDKKTRDEKISLALSKLKSLGAKNIKISKNEGRVYFSLDISDIINQYNQDYKRAKDEYESELNSLDIDKYKPNNVILDKLNNYRLKGSRVNVKAASLDKKLTYYYGSKILGWDGLKSDIWQAILSDSNLSYRERDEVLEICKAIDKRVSLDNDKMDNRPVDHIRFQSWFKNVYNFLENNNINYTFKSVQPHSAEIEKDQRNGRCWTIAYELEFPDFNNQKVRFCHHTSESVDGGDYGWGFGGYSGNYGKREIENLILNKIKTITNIIESYSELEIDNLNNLNEDFTVSFGNLPGRDYFDKIKQFARRIAQEVENKDIFKFTLDKDDFINIGLDPREFYNDLVDFLAEEGNYGISSITNHSNPSLFDYEYTVTLDESKMRKNKNIIKENKNYNFQSLKSIANKIENLLSAENIYSTVYPDDGYVTVYIDNGDWKHDHLRAINLIKDNFNVDYIESKEEDNGTDTYNAYHLIYFKDDPNVKEDLEDTNTKKCVICGDIINGWGNNPDGAMWLDDKGNIIEPEFDINDRCCNKCNNRYVISGRLYKMNRNKNGKIDEFFNSSDKDNYHLSDEEINKFEHIKIPGYANKWYAIDGVHIRSYGEEYVYYLMENETWGDETAHLVVTADLNPNEIYETYDDIETCLIDEGILSDYLDESLVCKATLNVKGDKEFKKDSKDFQEDDIRKKNGYIVEDYDLSSAMSFYKYWVSKALNIHADDTYQKKFHDLADKFEQATDFKHWVSKDAKDVNKLIPEMKKFIGESLNKEVTVENENQAEDILTKYIYVEDIDGKKIPTYIILDRIASAENLTKEDILDLVYKLNKKYKVFRVDAPNYERLILAAPEIKIDEIQKDFADYLLGKSIVTEITK